MNKTDKIIVALLVVLLGGWFFLSQRQQKEYRAAMDAYKKAHPEYLEQLRGGGTNAVPAEAAPAGPAGPTTLSAAPADPAAAEPAPTPPEGDPATDEPERTLVVSNAVVDLAFTSKGGALASATLREYRRELAEDSGPVVLDFAGEPALALSGIPGLGARADFSLEEADGAVRMAAATPGGLSLERTVAFTNGYHLVVTDVFRNGSASPLPLPAFRIGLGPVAPVGSAARGIGAIGPTEGIDVRARDARGRVRTLEQNAALSLQKGVTRSFAQMFGGAGGGCSAPAIPPSAPLVATDDFAPAGGGIEWIAVRDRFFVEILTPAAPAQSVRSAVRRNETAAGAPLSVAALSASLGFPAAELAPGAEAVRSYSLYVGPRKMDELRREGPAHLDVMRFGTWSWFCRGLLDLLNLIHRVVPNYGWSIVVTMRLYAENHVNPLAGCLPMLIQLPIFIALFTVLRSSVELRFAPWLWVADLSAPEGLFKEWFPFGGLNVLPIAMAATMALQSLLTPSAGDPKQQRMMAVMMPLMMLYFFYGYASALSLYWAVSQALAIAGLWWARREGAKAAPGAGADGSFTQKDGSVVIPPPRRR